MGATENLRREHQILRAKLKLLEVAMQMAPPPDLGPKGPRSSNGPPSRRWRDPPEA